MIHVQGGTTKEQHDLFELLRMLYPSFEGEEKDLLLSLYEDYGELSHPEQTVILKRQGEDSLLGILRQLTETRLPGKVESPWGTMVGIRPTKPVRKMLENNTPEQVKDRLVSQWGLSSWGAEFLIDVAQEENRYLHQVDRTSYSLYIHIPLCPTKCSYCSYATMKSTDKNRRDRYVQTLLKDMEGYRGRTTSPPVTIYIGGGTPSSIGNEHLFSILDTAYDVFGRGEEITVECGRPDTMDEELLQGLKARGVDRISINPQTMNPRTLENIGRSHGPEDIRSIVKKARAMGFNGINMDLILGLPGEGEEDFQRSLEEVLAMGPENITVHSLSLKNGAKLYQEKTESSFSPETVQELIPRMIREVKDYGYRPYYMYRQKRTVGNGINVGFALPGHLGKYNVLMMEEHHSILGLGMGSTSKFVYGEKDRVERVYQYKNFRDYEEKGDLRREEIFSGIASLNL